MTADDSYGRIDDEDYPAYTIGRAAEMLGTTQGFLRAIGEARLVTPLRSAGGHRRYSRYQLRIAARARELVDQGTPIEAAAAEPADRALRRTGPGALQKLRDCRPHRLPAALCVSRAFARAGSRLMPRMSRPVVLPGVRPRSASAGNPLQAVWARPTCSGRAHTLSRYRLVPVSPVRQAG